MKLDIGKYKTKVSNFIARNKLMLKYFLSVILVIVIIILAWHAFLSIVENPSIDGTVALIMVWLSVFIFIVILFPGVINKIRKVKFKGFEIELQDTVLKASSKDFISLSDIDNHLFSRKENFRNLGKILEKAFRSSDKPVLLVTNLKDDNYISIPMLFIYLFFLDLIGSSVTVLFISSDRKILQQSDIIKDEIIGAVTGKVVLKEILDRFPELISILDKDKWRDNSNKSLNFENLFRTGKFDEPECLRVFEVLYSTIRTLRDEEQTVLSRKNVNDWFKHKLSTKTIELNIKEDDLKTIRRSITEDRDFIIVLMDGKLNSIISLCYLAKEISRKTLQEIDRSKFY